MSISKVDVGTPPEGFDDWITKNLGWTKTVVCFHGFANLSTTRDERVESPEFSCFGHQWVLKVCPGGEEDSKEGYAAVELANKSNTSIKVRWGCSVIDKDCNEVERNVAYSNEFSILDDTSWITSDFAKRSKLMESLVEGTLIIEVRMKPTSNLKSYQLVPTNPINKNVLQKFMQEESADVVFEVDNESCQNEEERTNKKSKTTTTLYAHRFILQDISTMLAELCKPDESGEGITTVSITDVKPETFKHMIYYTYGGKLSAADLKNNAKDIINACDKYGVVHLKLEAEAAYVKSTEITMDNFMDNLLYADSKNLALLKEAAMDFILENKVDIMGKVSFSNVPGDMMRDLLAAVARGEGVGDDSSDDDEEEDESIKYARMRVGTLRNMLLEKGLDMDGSRETMIARLKEHNA